MLTRKMILEVNDLVLERVDAPEWAGPEQEHEAFFYVRVMTGAARDQFDILMMDRDPEQVDQYMRARMVVLSACDETGALLFTLDDIEALSQKSFKPLDRAWDIASRLNRVTRTDIEDAKKNS